MNAEKDNKEPVEPLEELSNRYPSVTLNEVGKLWVTTKRDLSDALGITPETLQTILNYPTFPRYVVEGKYYYNPIEVGIWLGQNELALPKKRLAGNWNKFREPILQVVKGKLTRRRAGAIKAGSDEFDNQLAEGEEEGDLGTTTNNPDIVRQKIRYATTIADMKDLEYSTKVGTLVDRSKFEEDEALRYQIFKDRWLKLPRELASRLEGIPLVQIEKILENTVEENLNNLNKFIMAIPVIGVSEETASEDDKEASE